jgi:hypothetical protein
VGGFEGGPDRVPLASKVSVALHMGQTRGPAFLAFKWVANLAYLPVSSILSPLPKNLRGILTDFPLGVNDRYGGGLPTGLLVPVVTTVLVLGGVEGLLVDLLGVLGNIILHVIRQLRDLLVGHLDSLSSLAQGFLPTPCVRPIGPGLIVCKGLVVKKEGRILFSSDRIDMTSVRDCPFY